MASIHKILNFEIRHLDKHGLSKEERPAVESLVKAMGYENLDQLVTINGYTSAKEIAEEGSFTNVRDYFLGEGWDKRTIDFRNNVERINGK